MDLYSVEQDLNAFDLYRKGKSIVLNPAQLSVTIADNPHKADKKGYSKGKYDCYELAEIQINGSYEGGTPRPFMFLLKGLIDNNYRHHVRPIFQNNMVYDKTQKGWVVLWDDISQKLQSLCEDCLANDVSPMLLPVTPETQKEKSAAGYDDTTLYATGQLFKAIRVEKNYIYDKSLLFR